MVLPQFNQLHANEESRKSRRDVAAYTENFAPFAKRYCVQCHNPDEAEGELDLAKFTRVKREGLGRKQWETIVRMLETGMMPPEGEKQPKTKERAEIVKWIESQLFFLDCDLPHDPGRVTIRRLNRAEYNNTIRDLLGVDLDLSKDFPSDDVGEGFDNIGDVLSLSPLLMEKYLDAAEKAASAAISANDPSQAPKQYKDKRQLTPSGAARLDEYGYYNLYSSGAVATEFQTPRDGEYLIEVTAGAQQAGPEVAKLQLKIKDRVAETFDVKAPVDQMENYTLKTALKAGKHRISAGFINDYYNPNAANPKDRDRNMFIRSIQLTGPVDVDASSLPPSHRNLITVRPDKDRTVEQAAAEVLSPFVMRAFRRPVADDEVGKFIDLVQLVVSRGGTFERGIQVAVSAVLVSPHFLFRIENDRSPDDPSAKRSLNDFELATRLSYFLWSTMPDEQLFEIAGKGELHRDDVLTAQVHRMLADAKSQALIDNFASQWLNLRNLAEMTMDRTKFKSFDAGLRRDLQTETLLFFESVMREDGSILDLIDGRYTFLNERLARHYDIDGVKGDEFRKVALNGNRAGVLTHGSILTLTSNPTRTSPVKRGKWIMENILGTPPPEPPANVPELAETQEKNPNASLREQLEQHSRNPSCAVCHVQMDALGFGLENFDAIGRWRDRDGDTRIDSSGTLPGGEQFNGPVELAEILRKREEKFGRAFAEKLLTFALGRGLQFYDRCTIDTIVDKAKANDYRFSTFVIEIAKSEPFLMRRGDGGKQ